MWQSIISSFENLTPLLWVSQICGIIGFILICISYQFDRKRFLLISSFSFVFFALESGCALLFANLIVSSMCLIRNILMFIYFVYKKEELPKYMLFILLGVMWLGELILMGITSSFDVFDYYLPPFISTFSSFTQNSKKYYIVKLGAIIHETGFLIYYIIYQLPFSILRQAILVISALVSLIIIGVRYFKYKKVSYVETLNN